MAAKKEPQKDNIKPADITSIVSAEERIQYLYREVFRMSDIMEQLLDLQKENNKLLVALLAEYKNIKNFDEKFLK